MVVLLLVQTYGNLAEQRVAVFLVNFLKDWSFAVKGVGFLVILQLSFNLILLNLKPHSLTASVDESIPEKG